MLPDHPLKLIQAGKYNKGPVVLGSNAREWGLFQLLGSPKPATIADLNTAIDSTLGATLGAAGAPLVKEHYKPATDADANNAFIRLMTDSAFRCAARSFARLITSQGSKAHLYQFDQGDSFHAYEIPYVYGNPNPLLAPMPDEPTVALVQGYWAQFVNTGDPNGKVQPTWPLYDAAGDQNVTLKSAPAVSSGLSKADCDFWDTLTAAGMM
jgi:para-nitrobenzyl esterase